MGMRPSALSMRKSSVAAGYGRLALQLVSHVLLAIWWAFVLMKLWNWFIPATFDSAPFIGVGVGVGVILIIRILSYPLASLIEEKDSGESALMKLSNSLASQIFTGSIWLFTGWIVYLLFM